MTSSLLPSLFTALNHCRNHSRVRFDEREPAKCPHDDHWLFGSRSMRYMNPPAPKEAVPEEVPLGETARTINTIFQQFQRCLELTSGKSRKPFTGEPLSLSSLPTAGAIRHLYSETIHGNQRGIGKVIGMYDHDGELKLISGDEEKPRFEIVQRKTTGVEETKKTIRAYMDLLVRKWGKNRIERALLRKKIDLQKKIREGTSLTVKEIKSIVLGISDYYLQDLSDCFEAVKEILKGREEELPEEIKKRLARKMKCRSGDLREELKVRFRDTLHLSYLELPGHLKALIQDAVLMNAYELELSFFGNRFEGILDGGMKSFGDKFKANIAAMDQQRLQMYQNIFLHKHEDDSEKQNYFDELLAKGLCKKELEIGMLIPSPWKKSTSLLSPSTTSFYYVKDRIITGRGKFCYQLEPLDKENNSLESVLLYRSTSSSPITTDAASTILVDLFPFSPPGYLWRRIGDNKERRAYFESARPLRLIGHSLGGSHAQLSLMHRIKRNKQWINDLPDRKIRLVTFDSPKIKFSTARSFKRWTKTEESAPYRNNIAIRHWLSENDIVPYSGEAPLGAYLSRGSISSNHLSTLSPLNKKSIYLTKNPHCRLYFHTRKDKDFTVKSYNETSNESYSLHLIEIIRKIVGAIFFPIIFIVTWIYRKVFHRGRSTSSFLNQTPLFTLKHPQTQ